MADNSTTITPDAALGAVNANTAQQKPEGAVAAIVTAGEDGKPNVSYYTQEQFGELIKNKQQLAELGAAQLVVLPQNGAAEKSMKLSEAIGLMDGSVARMKSGAEALWQQTVSDDGKHPEAAIILVDGNGTIVASQTYASQEAANAAIEQGKPIVDKDGKPVKAQAGQRLAVIGYDGQGKVSSFHEVEGARAEEELARQHREEKEKNGSVDWNKMMEKSLESGNMMMMLLCAVIMWASSKGGEQHGQEQTPSAQRESEAVPTLGRDDQFAAALDGYQMSFSGFQVAHVDGGREFHPLNTPDLASAQRDSSPTVG